MACEKCEARRKKLRDAIMHGKMAEAVGLSVGGLREMIGIKATGEPLVVVGEQAPELTTLPEVGAEAE